MSAPLAVKVTRRLGRRILAWTSGIIGVLLLVCSVAWWYGETVWSATTVLSDEQAFADGTFGLELAPLKYILVAQSISQNALGPKWQHRFGFLPRDGNATACAADAPQNLPVGFGISHRLPGNATPVPVQFVGLTCAACHAAAPAGKVILGVGSQTADVIGFTDAFLNAVLDPSLSSDKILAAYDRQCPSEAPTGLLGEPNRWVESFLIGKWLDGARAQARLNETKYDMPYHGAEIGVSANIPTGPSRTRPFRSVVRNTLDLPGAGNVAYSKVPLAAMQGLKSWSQFDGSIGDPVVRSMIAVFTSGASIEALDDPEISRNIERAAAYTLRLGTSPPLPTLAEQFPNLPKPSTSMLDRGSSVYARYCDTCHGHPDPSGWVMSGPASDHPSITPLAEIGTDPARLAFRYADMLPVALASTLPSADISEQNRKLQTMRDTAAKAQDFAMQDWWSQAMLRLGDRSREFPAGHRRAFPTADVARRGGYQNAPLPFMWLRAPYLHNASVPTLRQLIGLEPRPEKFCRGDAGYDPLAIGVVAPAPDDNGACVTENAAFLFDTSKPGNSNIGHLYPPPGEVSRDDLEALLTYLGTL